MHLSLNLLCFLLYIQFDGVVFAIQTLFKDGVMVVEGNNCNSSEIKSMLIDRNVSKIIVYLTHTFYADEDLKLNGIRESQFFANTWHCRRPVTFDFSGSDGVSLKSPIVTGSSGSKGNDGNDGGNFFGLANSTINCDHLSVILNGGNGGKGQAGSSNDDIYVLLNAESYTDSSGWSNSGDIYNYYQKYFTDRGYDDVEIIDSKNYTSLYDDLVRAKKANFNIRLHPQKCCGTTGLGGPGGHGGRSGTFHFKHLSNSQTAPITVGNDGSMGESGKNGTICENMALDVRIDVELSKAVLPMHHSFSSKFTVLNHVNSSKCSPEFVRYDKIENKTEVPTEPNEVGVASFIVPYRMFLLENMKNESLKSVAKKTYRAIDENQDLNEHNSMRGLLLEACELEKRYFELKETVDLFQFYWWLSNRVSSHNSARREGEVEELAREELHTILLLKLFDLKLSKSVNVNVNITEAVSNMKIENRRLKETPKFKNVEIQNQISRLKFEAHGRTMMTEYEHIIKAFQVTYFPFAIEFLDRYDISTSLSDYENLDHIYFTIVHKLDLLRGHIERIELVNAEIMMNLNGIDYSSPRDALFVWKHSDIRDNIRRLFAGEKITLLADVKKSPRTFSAMKFKQIDLYFRSSQRNITADLNKALQRFQVEMTNNGTMSYRCNDNFYQFVTGPLSLSFSFRKDEKDVPVTRQDTYNTLLRNQPVLSPYASWEIQIVSRQNEDISQLAAFAEFPIDIELRGTGKFVEKIGPICENTDLLKVFTKI